MDQAQQLQAQQASAQAAQQAQAFKQFADQQDKIFEQSIANEPAETRRAVTDNAARILQQHYGVDPQAFAQAIQQTPALRSAEVQRMLFDLIKMNVARENISSKIHRDIPVVQRPGTAPDRGAHDHQHLANLSNRLKASGDIKDATQLILARRTARGR